MRVALVSVSDRLGGSEAVLLQIVRHLRATRPSWNVHVAVPGGGPLGREAEALGASVHAVPMPPALSRLGEWGGGGPLNAVRQLSEAAAVLPGYERRFAALLDDIRPDVIHSNGFKAHVVAARARTAAARVWHIHEYVSTRRVTRRLLRMYGMVPQMIIVNSASVGADVRQALHGRVRGTIEVIHNGVDLDRFSPEGRVADLDAAAGLPRADPGTVRVGLVATFARWKGQDVFLRALGQLPPAIPVRGYVVGAPLYDTRGSQWALEELQRIAAASTRPGTVGFAGFQADIPAAMRALDIVVHASVQPEPFGLVIAEAMACERAVVTSGLGGAAELVTDGETALVHRAGDAVSLAATIAGLAADAGWRARLGHAARASVSQHFAAARFGEAVASHYEQLRVAGAA